MPGSLLIRPAVASDAAAISVLLGQLGYPTSPEGIPMRLAALTVPSVALVAEREAAVIGVVTAHAISAMHSPLPVAWLTMLVVAEAVRGGGVGRELVAHAERWARSVGAARISVTSGMLRNDAHDFYQRIGYAKTGVRFGKTF